MQNSKVLLSLSQIFTNFLVFTTHFRRKLFNDSFIARDFDTTPVYVTNSSFFNFSITDCKSIIANNIDFPLRFQITYPTDLTHCFRTTSCGHFRWEQQQQQKQKRIPSGPRSSALTSSSPLMKLRESLSFFTSPTCFLLSFSTFFPPLFLPQFSLPSCFVHAAGRPNPSHAWISLPLLTFPPRMTAQGGLLPHLGLPFFSQAWAALQA